MGSPPRPGRLIQLWPRKHKEEKEIPQHKRISYSPLWTHCWCRTWGGSVEPQVGPACSKLGGLQKGRARPKGDVRLGLAAPAEAAPEVGTATAPRAGVFPTAAVLPRGC